MLETLLSEMDDPHKTKLLFGVLGVTVAAVMVIALLLLVRTKNRLNWYEQNVLEMAVEAQHVRCKAFNRMDTDDADTRSVDRMSRHDSTVRKQSRIMQVKAAVAASLPKGDLSGIFHIPKIQKSRSSMFANPTQKEFDRGLYQCQLDDFGHRLSQDESVCSEEMGAAGSLQLALSLDPSMGILSVSLKQAMDIPFKRQQDDNPNPYFRIALDVPEGQKMEFQTKTFRNTSSPIIDEDFVFQLPAAQIASCRLEITVYDYDQFSVDECVGYCWLTLGRVAVSLDPSNPSIFWAEVLPHEDSQGKGFGEVLFSLSYLSTAQRLMMNVFKVRGLKCPETGGSISMRVTLMGDNEKRLKRKKTASKKNVRNLQFNESLTFNVPKHTLCDVSLEIEVLLETGTFGMNQLLVGRMELPLHRCKDLWRAIIREEKSQARWYALEEP